VGTEKRQRQKANRARRQAEETRAAKTDAVKRNAVRWVFVLLAAIAGVVLIAWIGGAFSSDDDETPTSTVPITLPQISVASTVAPETVPATETLPATDATTAAP
jgi:hypothetical protein